MRKAQLATSIFQFQGRLVQISAEWWRIGTAVVYHLHTYIWFETHKLRIHTSTELNITDINKIMSDSCVKSVQNKIQTTVGLLTQTWTQSKTREDEIVLLSYDLGHKIMHHALCNRNLQTGIERLQANEDSNVA